MKINKSVFSNLRQLSAGHAAIDQHRLHSSKPAAAACGGRTDGLGRRTEGHSTATHYTSSANNSMHVEIV